MSEVIQKHSRMPRKLSRRTLRKREQLALGGQFTLSQVDPKALVAKYSDGMKVSAMASEYKVTTQALYAFLLRHVPEEWIAAQRARAFAMKEAGEEGLDDSQDALDVAIAREKLRAGQWDLERVDRKNYGRDEQTININVVDLGDRLRRSRERIANSEQPEGQLSTAPSIAFHAGEVSEAEILSQAVASTPRQDSDIEKPDHNP